MRFHQNITKDPKNVPPSYHLFAYSKQKNQDYTSLITASSKILSTLADGNRNTKSFVTNLSFQPIYTHYDNFYSSCLQTLRSASSAPQETFDKLKSILRYEYIFTKEIAFKAAAENLSKLVEFLPHIDDPDLSILLLRTLAEKIRDADYKVDWEKQDLQWQVKLSRFISIFFEFFSQIGFESTMELFSKSSNGGIEKHLLTSLLDRVQEFASMQKSFVPLRDFLQGLVITHKEHTHELLDNLKTLFRQAKSYTQDDSHPDVYEISAILSLYILTLNHSLKGDKKILSFFIVIETLRVHLNSLKTQITIPKLKAEEVKWSLLAFNCLDTLDKGESENALPQEYLCLLQDLVPIYKFFLMKSRKNSQTFAIYSLNSIQKFAKELSKKPSFCMPLDSFLDESLIELISTIRKCIFLGYDSHTLEIGQHLTKLLLEPSFVNHIGMFTLKKIASFCCELLELDERFSSSLVKPAHCLSLFQTQLPHLFENFKEGIKKEEDHFSKPAYAILKYSTGVLAANAKDIAEVKDFYENVRNSSFIEKLPAYLQEKDIKAILGENGDLYAQILLLLMEYDSKQGDLLTLEKYLNVVLEGLQWLQINGGIESGIFTKIILKLFDRVAHRESLGRSSDVNQSLEYILIYFFHNSSLDGVVVDELGKYMKLTRNEDDLKENQRKITLMTNVLEYYSNKAQQMFESLADNKASADSVKLSEAEIFTAEVILGPLRLLQIILEPLYRKTGTVTSTILGQCTQFSRLVTDILTSPVMLFTPKEFFLSNQKAMSIVKRIPYLTSMADLLDLNYLDKIANEFTTVATYWPSGSQPKLSNVNSLLSSIKTDNPNSTEIAFALIRNSVSTQTLSKGEYSLLNIISLLLSFKEYQQEAKQSDFVFSHITTDKTWHGVIKALESSLPNFLDSLITFMVAIFSEAEALPVAAKYKVLEQWYFLLRQTWVGLTSVATFAGSVHLYETTIKLIFEHLLRSCNSVDLPLTTRQHLAANSCSILSVLSSLRDDVLKTQGQEKALASVSFLKMVDLNAVFDKINKVDVFETVNSFVRELLSTELRGNYSYTLADVESFYHYLSQNECGLVNFKKTLDYLQDLNSLEEKIRSKELNQFASNIKKHINNIILQQLQRNRTKGSSAHFDWTKGTQEFESFLKKTIGTSQEELAKSLESTINLLANLASRYTELSDEGQNLLDWTQVSQEDYPIKEEIILQAMRCFSHLSNAIFSKEENVESLYKEKKEEVLKDFSKVYEKISQDIRAYVSYTFLQGNKSTKSFQSNVISFHIDLVRLVEKNKGLRECFAHEDFFKNVWLVVYNLVLIDQDIANEITERELLEALLRQEYSYNVNWKKASLSLMVFDVYSTSSLPPRELIELTLKIHFAQKALYNQPIPLKDLLRTESVMSTITATTLEDDMYHVLDKRFIIKVPEGDKSQEITCEIQPELLRKLQSTPENSTNFMDNIIENLSSSTKGMLNSLINALLANYSYNISQADPKATESVGRRRLTTELLYQLLFILKKYPHLATYVFLKEIDPEVMKKEGLPSHYPYSKLVKSNNLVFLDFLVRIALKTDQTYALVFLDFTKKSGILLEVLKEENKVLTLDLNDILLAKTLHLVSEMIEEEVSSGKVMANFDAFESIRVILYFLLNNLSEIKNTEHDVPSFFRLTIHKLLDWVALLDKKKFGSDPINSSVSIIAEIVKLQRTNITNGKDSLTKLRDDNYLLLLKAFEGFTFTANEEGFSLKCNDMFNGLVEKVKSCKSGVHSIQRMDSSLGVSDKKRLYCVMQGKPDEVGLGFNGFSFEDKTFQSSKLGTHSVLLATQEKLDAQVEGYDLYFSDKTQRIKKPTDIGKKFVSPSLDVSGKNLAELKIQFSSRVGARSLVERFAAKNVTKTEPPSQQNTPAVSREQSEIKTEMERKPEAVPENAEEEKLVAEDFIERIVVLATKEQQKYEEIMKIGYENGLFETIESLNNMREARELMEEFSEEYFDTPEQKEDFLRLIFSKENKKDQKGKDLDEEEVKKDIEFIQTMEMFDKYIKRSVKNIPIEKLDAKTLRKHWFKTLNDIRKDTKSKVESLLVQLRRTLLEKPTIEKINYERLMSLLEFKNVAEQEYFMANVYDQAAEFLDDSVLEQVTKAKESVAKIEELVPPDEGPNAKLADFLKKYKLTFKKQEEKEETKQAEEIEEETKDAQEGQAKKPKRFIARSRSISGGNRSQPNSMVIPSITSLQGKPPPKFILTSKVVFCKDPIDYNELMPGKRQFAQDPIEDEQKVPLNIFFNYICCTDKQIEGLVEFLYLDSVRSISWKDPAGMPELFVSVYMNPLNEVKLIDTILFLLLNPQIYKDDEALDTFPFKMAYRSSVLGMNAPEKVYTIFAENALNFLVHVVKALSLRFVYLSLSYIKSFTIQSIQKLKSKHRFSEKTQDMYSILDLVVSLASVPEIKKDKNLSQSVDTLIRSVLDSTNKFKNRHYFLEINTRNLEYLLKTYGLDDVVRSFQGSPKPFMRVVPSIFEIVLSSLKKGIDKANDIVIKLKEIEKTKGGKPDEKVPEQIRKQSLEPIENTVEFNDIIQALYTTVESFFNYLFRPTYLFWKAQEYKNLIDKETFKVIEKSLENMCVELQHENLQSFMLFIYEILDVYANIVGKKELTYSFLTSKPAIKKLAEFAIYYYAIGEMKNRLDKEISEEEADSPLPKLSKMTSKEYTSLEVPNSLKRTFSAVRKENKIDFDAVFTNFGLKYSKFISETCTNNDDNVIGGLILLLCDRYPFLLNGEAQRHILKKWFKEYLYGGNMPSRKDHRLNRNRIIDSLAERLEGMTRAELARPMRINFEGESGIDEGGLAREFFTVLVNELFNPDKGLFRPSGNKLSVQPAADSSIVPNHLKLLELAGIVIAKAIIGDVAVDCTFTKSFLKHCLGRKLAISDLEDLDSDLAKNLQWILDNDVSDLGLHFTYDTKVFDDHINKELIEGGSQIEVTEENKKDYVMKLCEALMTKEIEPQLGAFLKGFRAILPARFLSHLSPSDLGLLISGTPTIDLEDMKANCTYDRFSQDSKMKTWFWEILAEFTQEELACLLYFVTGSMKLPIGGFKNRPFVLKLLDDLPQESLPIAHTCFYTLDLPNYKSKDKFREKLLKAIFEGKEGFYIS